MDVFLPDGDGLSMVRRLMERETHPDVIVITAARDAATVRSAMQLGAVHYLVKPFGFATLNERLQAYRRLRRRIAQLPVTAGRSDVDELFGTLRAPSASRTTLAKGHSTRPWNGSATPFEPQTSRFRRPELPRASASAGQPRNAI